MKISIYILCLFSSAMASIETDEIASQEIETRNDASVTTAKSEPFEYKPSERLKQIEKNMPRNQKEMVKDGRVKETMINTFNEAIASAVAQKQLAKLNSEWQVMVDGPEASRVIGTTSGNVRKVMTSQNGSKFIITVFATVQALLTKAGEEQSQSNGMGKLLSMIYNLLSLTNMPDIVKKTGTLIIKTAKKKNAALYVRKFWGEVKTCLSDEHLKTKLDRCFSNAMFLMKIYNDKMSPAKQLKQRK